MFDARELTVERIGGVLGVSRTSIYRALGMTTTPAPPATPAPAGRAAPEAAGGGRRPQSARGAGRAGLWCRPTRLIRSAGRWPVAVLSGHTSQTAAAAVGGDDNGGERE